LENNNLKISTKFRPKRDSGISHLFVAGEREGCGEDGLVILKDLVEVPDGGLEDRQQMGQTEVGHLVHVGIYVHLEGSHRQG
jgi:bisphosphoglycerate-independent phosphoglycerate mutase (AlkP superfamily)